MTEQVELHVATQIQHPPVVVGAVQRGVHVAHDHPRQVRSLLSEDVGCLERGIHLDRVRCRVYGYGGTGLQRGTGRGPEGALLDRRQRVGHADLPDNTGADTRAADALGDIPDDVLGELLDTCRADIVAEAGVDVEARAEYEIQTGAARDDRQLLRLPAETDTAQVDNRPAAQPRVCVEFTDRDVDVVQVEDEPVGVRVLAHPPQVLECWLGVGEQRPFGVGRFCEPCGAVAQHVLVRQRDTHFSRIHVSQNRAQHRHLSFSDRRRRLDPLCERESSSRLPPRHPLCPLTASGLRWVRRVSAMYTTAAMSGTTIRMEATAFTVGVVSRGGS